jgi:hypothetical protein
MDQSDCKEHFLEGEIRRFLDEKTYEGFCKLRMQNEIREVDPFRSTYSNLIRLIWMDWFIVHSASSRVSWRILSIEYSNVKNVMLQSVGTVALKIIIL